MSGRAQSNGLGKVHVVLTVAGIVFFLSAAGIVLSYGGLGPLIGGGAPNNSTASPNTSLTATATSQPSSTMAATTATKQSTAKPTKTTATSTKGGGAKTATSTKTATSKPTRTAKPTQTKTTVKTAKPTKTKTPKPTQTKTAKPTETKTSKPTTTQSSGKQATIAGYQQEHPTYTYGDTVWARVKVHNPTNQRQVYYLGYSVIGPNGKAYDNHHTTDQKVMVLPRGTRTAQVHWNVEQDAPTGKYNVVVALYTDRTPDGRLHHRVDKRTYKGVFRLTKQSNTAASAQGTTNSTTQ